MRGQVGTKNTALSLRWVTRSGWASSEREVMGGGPLPTFPKAPLSSPLLALRWATPSQTPTPCDSLQLLQVVTVAQTRRQAGQALGAHTTGSQPDGGQRAIGHAGALGLGSPECREGGRGQAGRWGAAARGGGGVQCEGALLPFISFSHRGIT